MVISLAFMHAITIDRNEFFVFGFMVASQSSTPKKNGPSAVTYSH